MGWRSCCTSALLLFCRQSHMSQNSFSCRQHFSTMPDTSMHRIHNCIAQICWSYVNGCVRLYFTAFPLSSGTMITMPHTSTKSPCIFSTMIQCDILRHKMFLPFFHGFWTLLIFRYPLSSKVEQFPYKQIQQDTAAVESLPIISLKQKLMTRFHSGMHICPMSSVIRHCGTLLFFI